MAVRRAALVLTAVNLPQSVFLLAGGAVGDRLGARRVMIAGDSVMLAVAAVLALVSWRWGTPLALLAVAGLIIGTVNAFYLPSSGSMPRQLVGDEQLPRALALNQVGSGLVSMVGGPVGGALVGLAGFTAASAVELGQLRRGPGRADRGPAPVHPAGRTAAQRAPRVDATGSASRLRPPGLAALLLLVGGVAGFVIPVTSLLVPLLARQHHWTADGRRSHRRRASRRRDRRRRRRGPPRVAAPPGARVRARPGDRRRGRADDRDLPPGKLWR